MVSHPATLGTRPGRGTDCLPVLLFARPRVGSGKTHPKTLLRVVAYNCKRWGDTLVNRKCREKTGVLNMRKAGNRARLPPSSNPSLLGLRQEARFAAS